MSIVCHGFEYNVKYDVTKYHNYITIIISTRRND